MFTRKSIIVALILSIAIHIVKSREVPVEYVGDGDEELTKQHTPHNLTQEAENIFSMIAAMFAKCNKRLGNHASLPSNPHEGEEEHQDKPDSVEIRIRRLPVTTVPTVKNELPVQPKKFDANEYLTRRFVWGV